jgi:hypothetical protein
LHGQDMAASMASPLACRQNGPDSPRHWLAPNDLLGDCLDQTEDVVRPFVKGAGTAMLPSEMAQEEVPERSLDVGPKGRVFGLDAPGIEGGDAADAMAVDVVAAPRSRDRSNIVTNGSSVG